MSEEPMSNIACTPAPVDETVKGPDPGDGVGHAVTAQGKLWPFSRDKSSGRDTPITIRYSFESGSPQNKKDAVKNTLNSADSWVNYGNIVLVERGWDEANDIRITFDSTKGSWSAIGTDSLNDKVFKDKDGTTKLATMNLGWLRDDKTVSDSDQGTILHEFGHAIGMLHELQSPARGGTLHLDEFAVYRYYRPLLRNRDDLVKSQIIDVYDKSQVANFSRFDIKSIMMYFMPAKLNQERIDVAPNTALSDLDKAFIVLNYPGNPSSKMTLDDALKIAGVVGKTVDLIKDDVNNGKYTEARDKFCEYNKLSMESFTANSTLIGDAIVVVSTAIEALGVNDKGTDTIIKDPAFHAIVDTIVKQELIQNGIGTETALPTNIDKDYVSNVVDVLLADGAVGGMIENIVGTYKLTYDVPPTPSN